MIFAIFVIFNLGRMMNCGFDNSISFVKIHCRILLSSVIQSNWMINPFLSTSGTTMDSSSKPSQRFQRNCSLKLDEKRKKKPRCHHSWNDLVTRIFIAKMITFIGHYIVTKSCVRKHLNDNEIITFDDGNVLT